MWAPQVFQYYNDCLGKFYTHYPTIQQNFFNSMFACCTFNLGPLQYALITPIPGICPLAGVQSLPLATSISSTADTLYYGTFTWSSNSLQVWLFSYLPLVYVMATLQFKLEKNATHLHSASEIFRSVEQGFQKSSEWYSSLSKEEKSAEHRKGDEN